MKLSNLVLAAAFFAGPVFAQTAVKTMPPPAPAAPIHPSPLAGKDITIAMKDYQIAQLQSQSIQTTVNTSRDAVMAAVAAAKKELKLDDTYDYDFNSSAFVKNPEAVKPATK